MATPGVSVPYEEVTELFGRPNELHGAALYVALRLQPVRLRELGIELHVLCVRRVALVAVHDDRAPAVPRREPIREQRIPDLYRGQIRRHSLRECAADHRAPEILLRLARPERIGGEDVVELPDESEVSEQLLRLVMRRVRRDHHARPCGPELADDIDHYGACTEILLCEEGFVDIPCVRTDRSPVMRIQHQPVQNDGVDRKPEGVAVFMRLARTLEDASH